MPYKWLPYYHITPIYSKTFRWTLGAHWANVMNRLFELGSLQNCDNSYPTLGVSEKLTSMSYKWFPYYHLESTYPLNFEWGISTLSAEQTAVRAKCYMVGRALGATS